MQGKLFNCALFLLTGAALACADASASAAAGRTISFGVGMAVGTTLWGGCSWGAMAGTTM